MTRTGGIIIAALIAAACTSPSSPTPAVPPDLVVPTVNWRGTLTRDRQTASVSLALRNVPLREGSTLIRGEFVAVYPSLSLDGTVFGMLQNGVWNGVLTPRVGPPCPTPLTTTTGSTLIDVTVSEERMAGDATLVQCEGRTVWAAEFTRR